MQVVAGQTAALALKKVKRNQVRKGMVLVDEKAKPKASWEFDADIAILTHSTTIQPRYQVCTQLSSCRLWALSNMTRRDVCKAAFVQSLGIFLWLVYDCVCMYATIKMS